MCKRAFLLCDLVSHVIKVKELLFLMTTLLFLNLGEKKREKVNY